MCVFFLFKLCFHLDPFVFCHQFLFFQYLYLLFSDDSLIAIDEWVMNTEAHPLPVRGNNALYRPASSKKGKL